MKLYGVIMIEERLSLMIFSIKIEYNSRESFNTIVFFQYKPTCWIAA